MANKERKGNREKRKPKAEKPKVIAAQPAFAQAGSGSGKKPGGKKG